MIDFYTGNRTPFVVLGRTLVVHPVLCPVETCKDWVNREFGISNEKWESLIRGCIMRDTVEFFTGSNYTKVDTIPRELIIEAITRHRSIYGLYPIHLYSGVVPGTKGTIWKPLSIHDEYLSSVIQGWADGKGIYSGGEKRCS